MKKNEIILITVLLIITVVVIIFAVTRDKNNSDNLVSNIEQDVNIRRIRRHYRRKCSYRRRWK